MKKMKYLLIMVMAVMISVCCSDDDDDGVNPLVGTWGFTETFEGEEIALEVSFKENLTGTLLVTYTYEGEIEVDESENFTWSTSGNELTMVIGGETDVSTYLIVGNKLTITSDGEITILTRQ